MGGTFDIHEEAEARTVDNVRYVRVDGGVVFFDGELVGQPGAHVGRGYDLGGVDDGADGVVLTEEDVIIVNVAFGVSV